MDDDDLIIHRLDREARLKAVAKRLTDIGDDLERKTRKNYHCSYSSWVCFITVIWTITAYCFQASDPDMAYL